MTQAEKPIAERKRALIAGLLFSVFMTLAFPPIGLWGFAFISISPLVWCAATTKKPLRAALFAGLGSAPFWVFEHRWLIDVTMAGYPALVVYLSLYPALFVWIMGRFGKRFPAASFLDLWILVAPIVWVGLEFLRSEIIFNGYPWFRICLPMNNFGIAASVIGMSGVSFLVAVYATGPGLVLLIRASNKKRQFKPLWRTRLDPANGALCLWLLFSFCIFAIPMIGSLPHKHPSTPYVRIGVIQTNVPQSNKIAWSFDQKKADFERFLILSQQAADLDGDWWPSDMIVWPETMFPGLTLDAEAIKVERAARLRYPDGTPTTYFYDRLLQLQRELDVPMLVGALGVDGLRIEIDDATGSVSIEQDALYNSVFLIENGEVSEQRYDKIHLTPFGEIMPYISASDWLESKLLSFGAQGMSFLLEEGEENVVFEIDKVVTDPHSLEKGSVRIVTPICFEGTMSDGVRRMVFDKNGKRQADLIVQLSNDGWFGDWRGGRKQHLQLMSWIAMETRTVVVRAVNTGISVAAGPEGMLSVVVPDPKSGWPSGEPWNEEVVRIGASLPDHPPPSIYLGNFIDWFTLAFTALAVIVPMVPVGSRSDRSGGGAHDSDDASEGTADAHAHPTDSPRTTGSEPDPGGSV